MVVVGKRKEEEKRSRQGNWALDEAKTVRIHLLTCITAVLLIVQLKILLMTQLIKRTKPMRTKTVRESNGDALDKLHMRFISCVMSSVVSCTMSSTAAHAVY